MGSRRRQQRSGGQPGQPSDPRFFVTAVDQWTAATRPVMLTEPQTIQDLAPYAKEMSATLRQAWEQEVENPCVLVIWRGSDLAKHIGLDRTPDPLTFHAAAGYQFVKIVGFNPFEKESAANLLPKYWFAATMQGGIRGHFCMDTTPDGVILSWTYSERYRRLIVEKNAIDEAGIQALEKLTGIKRS